MTTEISDEFFKELLKVANEVPEMLALVLRYETHLTLFVEEDCSKELKRISDLLKRIGYLPDKRIEGADG